MKISCHPMEFKSYNTLPSKRGHKMDTLGTNSFTINFSLTLSCMCRRNFVKILCL